MRSRESLQTLKKEEDQVEKAPKSWMTNKELARQQHRSANLIREFARNYRQSHPEWFKEFKAKGLNPALHYSPELIELIIKESNKTTLAPEGWQLRENLANLLGVNHKTIGNFTEQFRKNHPELFQNFRTKTSGSKEHFAPELVDKIKEHFQSSKVPPGWMSVEVLGKKLEKSNGAIQLRADKYRNAHPEWFKFFRHPKVGMTLEYYAPEFIKILKKHFKQYQLPPVGWKTNYEVSVKLHRSAKYTQKNAKFLLKEHPEWIRKFSSKRGNLDNFYAPELIAAIDDVIKKREENKDKEVNLKLNLEKTLETIAKGETLEAQDFRKLIGVFGANRVLDILYKYHPEYRNLPVEYVRSILSDYLGEFLVLKGRFSLDDVDIGIEYLSDPDLQGALLEVMKEDALLFYNREKRSNPAQTEREIINRYFAEIHKKKDALQNAHFDAVVFSLEGYYRALFEDIQKPANIVEALKTERVFPDINQRINIKEIHDKQRMLIADEMGMGKSASAILAKESLGLKSALVIVPSNVISTWKNYLSSEEGGYFKKGRAPRVLVIESPAELEKYDSSYDYVLISQERLDERYTEIIAGFNFDMVIVDEVHKLKNLTKGKRAQNLLLLSEKMQGEGKYLACLSGTPIPNKIEDIAMLLKLLYPEKFSQVEDKELVRQIIRGDAIDLRNLLVPRMQMKRLAESVAMPRLTEQTRETVLSPEEQEVYNILLEEDEITAHIKMKILRQFLLNPEIIDVSPGIASTKIQEVGNHLRALFAKHEKVVLFVNGYVEDVIRGPKAIFGQFGLPEDIEIKVIEGTVPQAERKAIQHDLKKENQKILLIVSGQTADVGVDFSSAQSTVFFNEPWTEYDRRQQLGRVYRPGLASDLESITFVAKNTIEEGMHHYIEKKYNAIEKLLNGVPISELEKKLLEQDEKQIEDADLEVNPELAEYYFSAWDKMMKIFAYVKEIGEEDFSKFLSQYGREYAGCYLEMGTRSYQANANRISATLFDRFIKETGKSKPAILDIASGPEMLKRHMLKEHESGVVSMDINREHFTPKTRKGVVGSFLALPFRDESFDYENLSMSWHYTNFLPSKQKYERLEVLKEMNRTLKTGGRVVLQLVYSLELKDRGKFQHIAHECGFEIVEPFTGDAESEAHYKSFIIMLEKVRNCEQDLQKLIADIGRENFNGLKFTAKKDKLKDSRKIITQVTINGDAINLVLNAEDRATLAEEEGLLQEGASLKEQFGAIEAIPVNQLVQHKFTRLYNGSAYILFKKIQQGAGAVIIR